MTDSRMTAPAATKPLLSVRGLTKLFPIKKGLFGKAVGAVRAVDNVSFDVMPADIDDLMHHKVQLAELVN